MADHRVAGAARRWPLRMLLALAGMAALPPAAARAGSLMLAIEATDLYKLAAFVTWPNDALPDGPMTVCVAGRDPFGAVLDRMVAGQKVQQRSLVVRRMQTIDGADGCQIMYVGGSRGQSIPRMLRAVGGAPVLTVTMDQDLARSGIVNMVLVGGRLQFQIDAGQAARDRLAISSKLLDVALKVRGNP